jgi:fructose-bisphosphate aldolase, class I
MKRNNEPNRPPIKPYDRGWGGQHHCWLALASDDTPLTDLALSYINALDPLDGLLLSLKKKTTVRRHRMNLADLNKVAQAMVASGKGILAADESSGTIKKRFDAIKVASTEDSRRDYREMMLRSKDAMSKYISGVILFDETIWQTAKDGTPLLKLIEQSGAIPGIKVDEGTQPLPNCPGELITVGLDKLAGRLADYYKQGARFAKWRAVIDIGKDIPSMTAIHVNAHALARYAALCQTAQIVPIVEPEVLMDGDHDIDRCYEVTQRVLNKTFQELRVQRVALEGMILKPNMAIAGKKSAKQASVEEVAEKTIRLLKSCVPAAVPGIAFLSGGQSDEDATAHLNAMNRIGGLPWKLTFSYGRALQAAPQKAWSGKAENVPAAQQAFTHRAQMNSLASKGEWKADLEQKKAA